MEALHWNQVPPGSPLGRAIASAPPEDLLGLDDASVRGAGDVVVGTSVWCELTLGVIDERARSLYGHGDCAVLALALEELTRWSLALLADAALPLGPSSWVHAGVLHPSGLVLDVWGLRPPGVSVSLWESRASSSLRWYQVEHAAFVNVCGSLEDAGDLAREVTRHFAGLLLSTLPAEALSGLSLPPRVSA